MNITLKYDTLKPLFTLPLSRRPNNTVNRIIPYNDLLINTVFGVKNKIW